MTPSQKRTYQNELAGSVAFPPLFEGDGGAVVLVMPVSYAGGRGDPKRGIPPANIEFEVVEIDIDGSVLSRETSLYRRG